MKNTPILHVAAKAMIVNGKGEVLIVRESAIDQGNTMVGLWGLPGGRLEPGESFFDALDREVMEEVGLKIKPIKPIDIGEWSPIVNGMPRQIIAMFILCKPITNEVILSDEHDEYAWVNKNELKNYKIMPDEQHVFDAVFMDEKQTDY